MASGLWALMKRSGEVEAFGDYDTIARGALGLRPDTVYGVVTVTGAVEEAGRRGLVLMREAGVR